MNYVISNTPPDWSKELETTRNNSVRNNSKVRKEGIPEGGEPQKKSFKSANKLSPNLLKYI